MESKLTDREIVAMHCLQGMLARGARTGTIEFRVDKAFQYADAFMKRIEDERSGSTGGAAAPAREE